MTRQDTRIFGPNSFKLGLFGQNCSGGVTQTKAPEYWDPSWENNIKASVMAEEAGLEFLLPVARWRGYGGEVDAEGVNFESLSWAIGTLSITQEITVFGTIHTSMVNPVFAANQMVTADHVGKGRFGLNMVSGWNIDEHAMFGVDIREHDQRYAYTEEWLTIVERIWSEDEPFDFKGDFFELQGVKSDPKPYFRDRPMLVSAGNSPVGRDFALRRADSVFMGTQEVQLLESEITSMRAATAAPRMFFGCGNMLCRRTRKEAEEFYHYIVHEHGDWDAAEQAVAMRAKGGTSSAKLPTATTERMIFAAGTYPIVGSYDDVVEIFRRMSEAGMDGLAFGLVNYLDDLPAVRDEVLPRMERLGLRQPSA